MGSSSYITNSVGVACQHMEYLPFGETLVDEHLNSINSPFKYNGKEYDAETGNYYYGARYYDPKWSVWTSVDPLAEKYPDWSPYRYGFNNPLMFIDPSGLNETVPVTGENQNQQQLVAQVNEVTGGNYQIDNGNLVAKDGNYGNGPNADIFKEAITSKNNFPINAVSNDDSTFVDSFVNTNVDVGDMASGSKEVKGALYAHFMKERVSAGSRYDDEKMRIEDMKPVVFGGINYLVLSTDITTRA